MYLPNSMGRTFLRSFDSVRLVGTTGNRGAEMAWRKKQPITMVGGLGQLRGSKVDNFCVTTATPPWQVPQVSNLDSEHASTRAPRFQ
jgi:hypothetical protein